MLVVREKRKGRKNTKSFNCVMSYSYPLRFSRTIIFFLFVHKGTRLLSHQERHKYHSC
jgi:hypothetical protein